MCSARCHAVYLLAGCSMFLLVVVAAVRVAIAADVTRGGDEEAAVGGPLLRQTVGPMTPMDGGHPPGGAAARRRRHSCNCSPPKAHWNAGTGHIGPVLAVTDVASCAAKCCAEHRCAAYAFRIAPDDDNAAITAAAPLNSPRGNCWLKDNDADGHVDASRASATCRPPQPAPPPPSPGPPNPPIAAVSVEVSSTGVYWHTDRRFKSWNIDASPNRGWEVRNLSQPKLHYLAAASLPGYLRFGGSGNDGLVYGVGNNVSACAPSATHCLNETHFRDFMSFTQASTAKLIFGLNIDPRTTMNEWDPTQARALMTYGRQHFGDDAFFAFELGKYVLLGISRCPCPNCFWHLTIATVYFSLRISPGADFVAASRTSHTLLNNVPRISLFSMVLSIKCGLTSSQQRAQNLLGPTHTAFILRQWMQRTPKSSSICVTSRCMPRHCTFRCLR
jgi:hypothetical protein